LITVVAITEKIPIMGVADVKHRLLLPKAELLFQIVCRL
jgi:hypothetical protein